MLTQTRSLFPCSNSLTTPNTRPALPGQLRQSLEKVRSQKLRMERGGNQEGVSWERRLWWRPEVRKVMEERLLSKSWGLREVLWSTTCRQETQESQGVSLSLSHNLQTGQDWFPFPAPVCCTQASMDWTRRPTLGNAISFTQTTDLNTHTDTHTDTPRISV